MKAFVFSSILLLSSYIVCAKQWIAFYADEGFNLNTLTGHAYVGFIKENHQTKQTVMEYCWGFYPDPTADAGIWGVKGLGIFNNVPGVFKDDIGRRRDMQFVVEVDQAVYAKALAVKNRWLGKQYLLWGAECTDYMREVVATIPGLSKPTIVNVMPQHYLAALRDGNVDRIARDFSHDRCVVGNSGLEPISGLNKGARLLFSKVRDWKTKEIIATHFLSAQQMNSMFTQTGLRLSANGLGFYTDDDCGKEWKDTFDVYLLDLNSDGRSEVMIEYGNYCEFGNIGGSLTIFSVPSGNPIKIFYDEGSYAPHSGTSMDYKNFVLGGPGMTRPLIKWNGKKYVQSGRVDF